ncbi:hypothetical protein V5O48_014089 [Marasmius crinis-equi]|uniref:Uncharacterized protein n=1 Tax=Marasmius crinis-equi TaxID=585013 RepID=A0ABR3EYA0_9AGAR
MLVEHADRESLEGLGLWISRKRTDASGRLWVSERPMEDSGHPTQFLRSQWGLQKKTQTQPLPKQSNQQGRKAVQEVLRLWESLNILKDQKDNLEQAILDIDSKDWDVNVQKLPVVTKQIAETEKQVRQKELLLGVEETQEIRHLMSSPYLRERMNALAIKTRLVAHLRSRKFQQDRLERSYRKQTNEEKIHTQIARYNEKVLKMEKMVLLRQAPRNAVPPKRIPMDQLFSLYVDDEIWQDVGLTDKWDIRHRRGWQTILYDPVFGGC